MAHVVLLHHVQGRTDGVLALADALREGGHTVVAPDCFDGARPSTIEEGVALVRDLGDDLERRVDRMVDGLPQHLVYAGVSWGAGQAQRLAQTRRGARGALLYEACLPVGEEAYGPWPDGVPVQVHGMGHDPFFGLEGDVDAAGALVDLVGPDLAELFVYPGDRHLFTDASSPSSDAAATALVVQRSLRLLDRVDRA